MLALSPLLWATLCIPQVAIVGISGDAIPDLWGSKLRHTVDRKWLDLGAAGACS